MKIGENNLNHSFALGYLMGNVKQVLEYGTVSNESFRVLAESIISVLDPGNPHDIMYFQRIKQLADERGVCLGVEL